MKIDRYPDRLLKTQNTLPHSRAATFQRLFPDGMEMTEENILKALEEGLDVVELLDLYSWQDPEEGKNPAVQAISEAMADRRTEGQAALTACNNAKDAARRMRERRDLNALREFDFKRVAFKASEKRANDYADKTYQYELNAATHRLAKALASAIASAELSQTASVS